MTYNPIGLARKSAGVHSTDSERKKSELGGTIQVREWFTELAMGAPH